MSFNQGQHQEICEHHFYHCFLWHVATFPLIGNKPERGFWVPFISCNGILTQLLHLFLKSGIHEIRGVIVCTLFVRENDATYTYCVCLWFGFDSLRIVCCYTYTLYDIKPKVHLQILSYWYSTTLYIVYTYITYIGVKHYHIYNVNNARYKLCTCVGCTVITELPYVLQLHHHSIVLYLSTNLFVYISSTPSFNQSIIYCQQYLHHPLHQTFWIWSWIKIAIWCTLVYKISQKNEWQSSVSRTQLKASTGHVFT